MVGTTRSLGFIHYNGGIQVHSSLLNVVLHDEPHIETEQIETEQIET